MLYHVARCYIIFQGVAGVVLEPIRGAEAGGAAGFVRGVGKGLAGLAVKPLAGVLDFVSQVCIMFVNYCDSFLFGFGV